MGQKGTRTRLSGEACGLRLERAVQAVDGPRALVSLVSLVSLVLLCLLLLCCVVLMFSKCCCVSRLRDTGQ